MNTAFSIAIVIAAFCGTGKQSAHQICEMTANEKGAVFTKSRWGKRLIVNKDGKAIYECQRTSLAKNILWKSCTD